MRYILYARKSSEGDERQVQSIPDQHAVLVRLADQHGLKIVGMIDEARSAKQPGTRPGFDQLMNMLKAGEAEGILCWHLNRLSRNPVDSGTLSWLLQQGVISSIRTADREYKPDDNVVVMAVENAVSNQFIVDLRRNVLRGQREKALRGWFPHKPPPGYRTDPETHEIVPDTERFQLIRRAWDYMLTGAYTVPEVLKLLDEWGFRHRRTGKVGRPINRSGLYSLFDNPFYYGEFRFTGETFQGKHPPMVTRDEFQVVQSRIHKREPFSQKKPEFAYTGLIRCGECGCLITAERKIKRYPATNRTAVYTYYHCSRSKGCKEPSITESYLDNEFKAILKKIRLDIGLLDWLRRSVADLREATTGDAEQIGRRLRSELEILTKKRSRLLELRLAGEITADEFAELGNRLKAEMTDCENRIRKLDTAVTGVESTMLNAADFAGRAFNQFTSGSIKAKREIVSVLSRSAILSSSKLTVDLHPVLAPLLTLEPPQGSDHMVWQSPLLPMNPVWQGWLDQTRTLITEGGESFPALECLRDD